MLTRCSQPQLARWVFRLFILCLLVLLPLGAQAATFLVTDLNDYNPNDLSSTPDPGSLRYAVNQAAISAPGGVVLFQKGLTGTIHLTNTLFVNTGTLVEGPGAGQIALSGGNAHVVVYVSGSGSVPAALSGLTIENGKNDGTTNSIDTGAYNPGGGAGVWVYDGASLALSNCVLTGNVATGDGGALLCGDDAALTVTGCTFTNNTAPDGGAFDMGRFSNNSSTVTFTGCTFSGNSVTGTYGGGAISISTGAATLTNCTLSGNSAAGSTYGEGGAVLNSSTVILAGCTLANNTGGGGGGGLLNQGTASLTNCLITGNTATQGGGLDNGGTMTVTGSTLTGNSATGYAGYYGGGLDNSDTVTLTNDVIYGNTGGTTNAQVASDFQVHASYCDIGEALGGGGDNVIDDGHNINQDPLFVNAAAGDFHLQPGSPGLGAGATQSQAPGGVTLPATDLDGAPRPASTPPTIGAYEGYELIVNTAADPDNATGGNGTTLSLREAVNQANAATSYVRILFDPAVFATAQTITETQGTIALTGVMTIQGPAIGVAVSGNSANLVMSVVANTAGAPDTLANLTIENGSSAPSGSALLGGGLNNKGVLSLIGCTITANATLLNAGQGQSRGGGVWNGGTLTLTVCTVSGNSSQDSGGGVYNDSQAVLTLTGCTFSGNSTYFSGAGIENNGTVTLTGCLLTGNTAGHASGLNSDAGVGGGLDNGTQATATLTNCVLAGNTADYGGGISNGDSLTLTDCTVTGNKANLGPLNGGGIANTGTLTLLNDILYGDTNGEVTPDNNGQASYCDIGEALGSGTNGDGLMDNGHNINLNPLFFSPPTDLHLDPGSPCVGAGTATGAPATDVTGLVRPVPPSIGAYEVVAQPASSILTTTTTTLTSSLNPSKSGQNVTLTVRVAPATGTGTPSGAVTFTVDGTVGSPVTLTLGKATLVTSTLTPGTHTVTAAYSGDSAYATSNSNSLTQTVLQTSTTTLTSSLNPSTFGQSVTFTATVAAGSGTVTFSVNNVAQTPVTLTGGTATFITSSLPVGSNSITAAYSGDGTYAASTSAALTETVNSGTTGPTVLHTFTPGLQMVSFTESYAGVTNVWNAPSGQILYTWAGGPNYGTGTTPPALGHGAWVYVTQNVSVYDTGQTAPTTGPFSISLTAGWNLIGDPFNAPVPLSGVSVRSGSSTYTLTAANQKALVFSTLYTYPAAPPSSPVPYTSVGPTGSLTPFAGYWIYAFKSCTLSLPVPAASLARAHK